MVKIKRTKNDKIYEKEIAVQPVLTVWMDSASSYVVGWAISIIPNSDTIAEAFARACVYTVGDVACGIPKTVMARHSQIVKLKEHLRSHPGYMLIFDNVSLSKIRSAISKLDILRKLNEYGQVPIIISGVNKLRNDLYSDKNLSTTCSIVTRLDEYELHGMSRVDAGNYLGMVSKVENVKFTYPAQQALVFTALNKLVGGINAMVTVLGRCITLARAQYYTSEGRTIPDKTECVRSAAPNGKEYPGAELVLILPKTPEPVLIDEILVAKMQSEYKSHFPMLEKQVEEASMNKNKKRR